jgi:hypothetical protein
MLKVEYENRKSTLEEDNKVNNSSTITSQEIKAQKILKQN